MPVIEVFQAHPSSGPCNSPSHVLWAKLSPVTWPQHFVAQKEPITHTVEEVAWFSDIV